MNIDLLKKLNELINLNSEFWTATVVKSEGHTPAIPGMKMIIESDGNIFGTIGGGDIEKKIIDYIMNTGPKNPLLLDYNLGSETEESEQTTMICGGIQSVFIEPNNIKPLLYIIGGGHCGNALSELAHKTGFSIIILDNREDLSKMIKHIYVDVNVIDYNNIINYIMFSENIYIVIMTHSHQYDEFVLEKIINKEYKYLGMIGSREKVKTIFDNLIKKGFEKELVRNVFSPIGFDIGSHTPEEIAVSVIAQIIAVRNGKNPMNNNPLLFFL
ncbi:MAG: XdhC family protein [Ignavibacteria bacterium]|nr:XdhC family protein [Ignavibacteria bacterium]